MSEAIADVLLGVATDFRRVPTLTAAENLAGLARMFCERLSDTFADRPKDRPPDRPTDGLDTANLELLEIANDWSTRIRELQ